ncbi:MAG: hydantoinase/oxoprolinase family protein [Leucobacter sp.]
MSFKITIDTGGTFTDVVVSSPGRAMVVNKALTTPQRAFDGILEALRVTAQGWGLPVEQLIAETEVFVYATTRSTNAILEEKTARTALITTKGFADILTLREGGRTNAFDRFDAFPRPFIPRSLTFEIDERIGAGGEVIRSLQPDDARRLLGEIAEQDIEAIAVSLIWSVANGTHEQMLAGLIEEALPGVPYTLGSALNPVIREFRRTSAAAIDASLKPLMQRHLADLESDLREHGFMGRLLTATSFGGMWAVDDLIAKPIFSARSGPSLAPIAGKTYAGLEGGSRNAIICDTGGTSFDVSLVADGEVAFTNETWLGERFRGHLTGLSSVDARSVGAGGGSIAWIDEGGLLRVGPHSAGSVPGPACYGRGGEQPTVTDAAVVAGYLNPDYFLGGRIELDVEASRRVLRPIAERLGQSIEVSARSVLRIANELMIQAVQEIAVSEALDIRDSLIIGGGGAAGISLVEVVKELGVREVLIPNSAGGLSASGAQFSAIVTEATRSSYLATDAFDPMRANKVLAALDAELDGFRAALGEIDALGETRSYSVEARYAQQVWEIAVPLRASRFETEVALAELVEDFHAEHRRRFAVHDPNSALEILTWRARLTVDVPTPAPERETAQPRLASSMRTRSAYFDETGRIDTPVHRAEELGPGDRIPGPAIIEEPTTTIVVYPGTVAEVTPYRNYLISVRP